MDVQAQEIGKRHTCPCGSGRDYEDCCEKAGITYGLLKLGSKEIVFDVEETNQSIQDLMGFLSNEVLEPCNEGASLDTEAALEKLYNTYKRFEKSLSPFSEATPCKKGCTACCHHVVQTTAIEAEAVRQFIKKQFDRSAQSSLLSRINQCRNSYPKFLPLDEEYDEEFQDNYFEKRIPCPFLSTDGSCMVYGSRPLVCRTYMVFSDPEQCIVGDRMAVYEAEYFPEIHRAVHLLSLLSFKDIRITRHLPDWFINEFQV
jgi:Fe-S-cluster containining protein